MNRTSVRSVRSITTVALGMLLAGVNARAEDNVVEFASDRWVLKDAEVGTHLGRSALSERGSVYEPVAGPTMMLLGDSM